MTEPDPQFPALGVPYKLLNRNITVVPASAVMMSTLIWRQLFLVLDTAGRTSDTTVTQLPLQLNPANPNDRADIADMLTQVRGLVPHLIQKNGVTRSVDLLAAVFAPKNNEGSPSVANVPDDAATDTAFVAILRDVLDSTALNETTKTAFSAELFQRQLPKHQTYTPPPSVVDHADDLNFAEAAKWTTRWDRVANFVEDVKFAVENQLHTIAERTQKLYHLVRNWRRDI